MSVVALNPDYHGPTLDKEQNFHGNRVTYVHWEQHLMFCAALAFPLPPQMPFGALRDEVMATFYGPHPDWAQIDWDTVKWELDGETITPTPDKSLEELGFKHKSLLRFWTPGLDGWKHTAS